MLISYFTAIQLYLVIVNTLHCETTLSNVMWRHDITSATMTTI